MTAEEICRGQVAQWADSHRTPDVVRLALLREQDFGSFELVPWASKRAQAAFDPQVPNPADPNFRPQETKETMVRRAEDFLSDYILPLLATSTHDVSDAGRDCVAVVSHGLFLSTLWRVFLSRFHTNAVRLGPGIESSLHGRSLAHLPSWSNTGFLEAKIDQKPHTEDVVPGTEPGVTTEKDPGALSEKLLTILAINGKDHLSNLKRTRGGLGSTPFDTRQQNLDGFFKRPRSSKDASSS